MKTTYKLSTAASMAAAAGVFLANAETVTLLESFEDNADNVSHLADEGSRRIDSFSVSEDNALGQITDGAKALKVSFSAMNGWQRDFQVLLDVDATTLLQNVIDTEDTGRYYLLYDITWDNTNNDAAWANDPLEIGGWLFGDQIEWGGGGQPVTMAYELGAGTPDGFALGTAGDNDNQTFLNFIFNSNTTQAMDVYVDNIRLLDTQPPGAATEETVLNSFEVNVANIAPLNRAEEPATNSDETFVTDGANSALVTLTGDGGWGQDMTIDLFSDALASILELPKEERYRYTLAWDWFVELGDGASADWFQQAVGGNNLTQAWAGNGGMRTRTINLGLEDWDTPPALTLIHNSNWSGGNVNIYIDNVRVIDTGFVPNIFSLADFSLDDSGFSFSWNSRPGKMYQVHRSDSIAGSWEMLDELTADSETSSFQDADASASASYYQVTHVPSPPIFEDDFESGAPGWTTSSLNPASATTWELGTPTNERGPETAHSGNNVYGTDLDADYEFLTTISLRSPVIDLSGLSDATLIYWGFQDLEPLIGGVMFDFIQINILDASGNDLLGEPLRSRAGSTQGWQESKIGIPDEALGQRVIIEFVFNSDDFNAVDADGAEYTQAGWFIDDVSVVPE